MQSELARLSTMPTALVLSDLLHGHAGDPPLDVLEQAGFSSSVVEGFLKRRAARQTCCASSNRSQ